MGKSISFKNLLEVDEKMKWRARDWRNSDFVRKFMLTPNIVTENEHSAFLEKLKNSVTDKYYIAFYGDEPLGILNMHLDASGKGLEFGYYLSDMKYVDGGFGVILEFVLLEHAFNNLKLDTVFCRTLSINKKVVALHRRFGFDMSECDGRLCHQNISVDKWEAGREYIGNIISKIIPLDQIGRLE